MDVQEFRETLRRGGVDIDKLQASLYKKPIYFYGAKGPILLEDQHRKLVGVVLDYKDRGYPLTPAVHDTHVFPGGRWEATDTTPQDTFQRERGEEYFIPHNVLTGEVVTVGDFYSQFPCSKHGTYADLTSIFANRVPIAALRDALQVTSTDLDSLVEAINRRAGESRQRVISADQLMKEVEKFGFMDGKKLVRTVEKLYETTPKVSDTKGGVLIELPTKPTDTYESRRAFFDAYLFNNKLSA